MLQRLFSAFPGGRPGLALLLLRVAVGVVLVIQGWLYLTEANAPLIASLVGVAGMLSGLSLVAGYMTPVASGIAGLGIMGVACTLLPECKTSVFDTRLAVGLAALIALAVALLGPGAFSVDAKLFGRREIVLRSPDSPSNRK